MTRGQLCAALGKVAGRFIEGYGSYPDLRDPVDVHALADLLHEELGRIVEREVRDRLQARLQVQNEQEVEQLRSELGKLFDERGEDE